MLFYKAKHCELGWGACILLYGLSRAATGYLEGGGGLERVKNCINPPPSEFQSSPFKGTFDTKEQGGVG